MSENNPLEDEEYENSDNDDVESNIDNFFVPSYLQINYRYTTGTPYTPLEGIMEVSPSRRVSILGDILSARNPDYSNLNLRVEWGLGSSFSSFIQIWNFFNHKNLLNRRYFFNINYPNNLQTQNVYQQGFLFGGGFKVIFRKDKLKT